MSSYTKKKFLRLGREERLRFWNKMGEYAPPGAAASEPPIVKGLDPEDLKAAQRYAPPGGSNLQDDPNQAAKAQRRIDLYRKHADRVVNHADDDADFEDGHPLDRRDAGSPQKTPRQSVREETKYAHMETESREALKKATLTRPYQGALFDYGSSPETDEVGGPAESEVDWEQQANAVISEYGDEGDLENTKGMDGFTEDPNQSGT